MRASDGRSVESKRAAVGATQRSASSERETHLRRVRRIGSHELLDVLLVSVAVERPVDEQRLRRGAGGRRGRVGRRLQE